MALYESTFIVRQDMSTQEVEKITENFTKIIGDNKGKVVKKEYWGLLSLAYKVKKSKKGHYVILFIEIPSINELLRQYKLSEDVIRSLTVKVEEFPKEATPMLKQAGAPRTPAPRKSYNTGGQE